MARRVVLHVDMDAFYASVEQREHPSCAGRSLIVGADPKGGEGRGVVAACSYEARRFGIHSAMPISRAYRLCPQAVFVRPDPTLYSRVSKSIMEILGGYTDQVEPVSIDEAFLDVTSSLRLFGKPSQLARGIKRSILEKEQLTCSIGIAVSKFVAKIASDLCKPDGLLQVVEGTEKEFLGPLPVGRMWGVGPKTEEWLHRIGVQTIAQVAARSERFWEQQLGRHGRHLWRLSQGWDEGPVVRTSSFRSLSQERTFDRDTCDLNLLSRTLLSLSEGLAQRIRGHQVEGRTVALKIRFEDFSTFTRQRSLGEYTDDSAQIRQVAQELLNQFLPLSRSVRLLGVRVAQFRARTDGLTDLFGSHRKRRDRLNSAVDAIASKYGEKSIRKAGLLGGSEEEKEAFTSFLKR